MTGDLDGTLIQRSVAPPYYPEYYPHQADFNNDLNHIHGPSIPQFQRYPTAQLDQSLDFPRSPSANQLPATLVANDQPFEPPTCPLSPTVGTPSQPPAPQPLPVVTGPKYVMELHIITKTKGKRAKVTEEFKMMKAPIKLALNLTYSGFLTEVAKVAGVKQLQLDREHMRWKHRKPASASPINVSEDQSYSIMVQAIQSKKEVDRWIIVEMGKPLLSKYIFYIYIIGKNPNSICSFMGLMSPR